MRQQQRHRLLQPSSIFPLFTVILDCLSVREISIRRFWELPRPQNWFQLLLDRPDLDSWWREHFRVNRGTFTKIVEIARPHMQTEDSRLRRATSVEKKVAAALWRLANGHSYRTIGITLGMGTSSAMKYTHDFCVLCDARKKFIRLPSSSELPHIIQKFGLRSKISNVIAAVDDSHIPVLAPIRNKEDYFDRKHRYSILMQGLVGPDLQFFDVFVGVPGSVHDSRLLRLSKFGGDMFDEHILQEPTLISEGMEVKPIILGDSAYPLTRWLIPPYKKLQNMSRESRRFNDEHVRSREPVERAFGVLKGRWRIINTEVDEEINRVKVTVMAQEDDTAIQPVENEDLETNGVQSEEDVQIPDAVLLRDVIAELVNIGFEVT